MDERLREVWSALAERALERWGSQWEIWFEGAHPHGIRDGTLIVAVKPAVAIPVVSRWTKGLNRAGLVELQVGVVACEALEGSVTNGAARGA